MALDRARQVGNTNLILGDPLQLTSIEEQNTGDAASSAILTPGRWVREEAECLLHNQIETPCFLPMALDDANPEDHPNAFELTGRLFPEGSKNYFAGSFLGSNSLGIKVHAVSSLVPRKGCFMVDISVSTVRDTHKEWGQYRGRNSDDTFYQNCPPASSLTGGYEYAEFAYDINTSLNFGQPNFDVNASGVQIMDIAWDCMARSAPRALDNSNTTHYYNDYQSYTLINDHEYNFSSLSGTYQLYHPNPIQPDTSAFKHHFTKNDNFFVDVYSRPEPLNTIFEGINEAIAAFSARAVAGDDICLIFFDDDLDWPRVVQLTTGVDPEVKFQYLDNLTDFTNNFDQIIRHGMFPEYFSNTNIQQALYYAQNEFSRVSDVSAGGVPSSNFLVLITDGLGNCRKCTAADKTPPTGVCVSQATGEVIKEYHCSQRYREHIDAMLEIKQIASGVQGLAEQRIPLHVILVGDEVAPHTNLIYNEQTQGCYTDQEYRNRPQSGANDTYDFVSTLPFTDSAALEQAFLARSAQTPYLNVNRDFYEVAVTTKGIWGPIRPACNTATQPICTTGMSPQPLFCDPQQRSTADQIRQYFNEIISFNPYAIVLSK